MEVSCLSHGFALLSKVVRPSDQGAPGIDRSVIEWAAVGGRAAAGWSCGRQQFLNKHRQMSLHFVPHRSSYMIWSVLFSTACEGNSRKWFNMFSCVLFVCVFSSVFDAC